MSLSRALSFAVRVFPILSLLLNRLRFPSVKAGIFSEFPTTGNFVYGSGLVVGALSRIYLGHCGVIRLGRGVMLGRNVHLQTSDGRIEIGNRTSVQDNCRLYGDVSLGDGCILAPNIYASSGNHIFDQLPHLPIAIQETLAPLQNRPIAIGDDCWIGVNAVILGGVAIGNGAIVGAGAVVTSDVRPYAIAAGVPARTIGMRLDFLPPATIDARKLEDWPYFYSGFDKSAEAHNAGAGLAATGGFVLALTHPTAQTLLVRGQTGPEGAILSFNGEMRSFEGGEVRFNLPSALRGTDRLELTASDRVVIASAQLV